CFPWLKCGKCNRGCPAVPLFRITAASLIFVKRSSYVLVSHDVRTEDAGGYGAPLRREESAFGLSRGRRVQARAGQGRADGVGDRAAAWRHRRPIWRLW